MGPGSQASPCLYCYLGQYSRERNGFRLVAWGIGERRIHVGHLLCQHLKVTWGGGVHRALAILALCIMG